MVRVPERPGLVRVEVRVAPDARAREVGMGQEASLSIKGRAVSVETRRENDGYVHVPLAALQLTVGDLLEGQRGHVLPHVEGSADSFPGLRVSDFGSHVLYAGMERKEGPAWPRYTESDLLQFASVQVSASLETRPC